jgi:hypothetical protein
MNLHLHGVSTFTNGVEDDRATVLIDDGGRLLLQVSSGRMHSATILIDYPHETVPQLIDALNGALDRWDGLNPVTLGDMVEDEPMGQVGELINVRVRQVDDARGWAALPVRSAWVQDAGEANEHCQAILDDDPMVQEVRWNWAGSTQGHYVWNRSE